MCTDKPFFVVGKGVVETFEFVNAAFEKVGKYYVCEDFIMRCAGIGA
ncbi:MAG: hypothetical protein FWG44_01680 [Oscillospiraceae bacterium]|nr:hypothetical protein [Oscillospiraceae bacterium]